VSVAGGGPRARRKSSGVGCPCPRLGSGEARSCPLSVPILDLIAPIRPLQLCADEGYQLRLGVLRVPLIMVPDKHAQRNPRVASLELFGPGAPDTVRWYIGQSGAPDQGTLGSFAPLILNLFFNLLLVCVEPLCTCRIYNLEQTS
jgi:hypothetical protein